MLGARAIEIGRGSAVADEGRAGAGRADLNAVRAPRRSRGAFRSDSRSVRERSIRSAPTARAAPAPTAPGRLSRPHLAVRRTSPSETSTASVNVPPTSIPSACMVTVCEPAAARSDASGCTARPRSALAVPVLRTVEYADRADRLVCLGSAIAPHPSSSGSAWARSVSARSAVPGSRSTFLTTCYRVELYAYLSGGVEEAREELIGVSRGDARRRTGPAHRPPVYVHARRGRRAPSLARRRRSRLARARRIRVLGQVGDAFSRARMAGTTGPVLSLLFRTALALRPARARRDRRRGQPRDGELDGAGARRGDARRSPRPSRAGGRSGPYRRAVLEGGTGTRSHPDRVGQPHARSGLARRRRCSGPMRTGSTSSQRRSRGRTWPLRRRPPRARS